MSVVVALFGPTAVGKSWVAVEVARRVGGEVVNADATQVYRGLDLGAAKLPFAERQGIAHHLLDLSDPQMPLSVAAFQEIAMPTIGEVLRRGRVPIVCGGSGLYLRAALGEWIIPSAPPDPVLRAWAREGRPEELYREALAADPTGAAQLSPQDRPRLLRLIERARGGAAPGAGTPPWPVLKVGLSLPRAELHQRIERRAEQLWPHLLAEAGRLLERAAGGQLPAVRALGYREALQCLRGELRPDEGVARLCRDTRRLAKRQMTWWRRERNAVWLRPDDAARAVSDLVEAALRQGGRW